MTAVDAGMRDYVVSGPNRRHRPGAGRHLRRRAVGAGDWTQQRRRLRTSDFAQSFTAVGSQATIRVYRTRRDYTETSINLGTADGQHLRPFDQSTGNRSQQPAAYPTAAISIPTQLSIQITSVQAATPSLYVVSGIISGHNIASAGIYQNGVLSQPLNLSSGGGGGIGGLISGLIPGTSRQVSFVGRFNPALGFATVRAYDRNGLMTEQPVSAGGFIRGKSLRWPEYIQSQSVHRDAAIRRRRPGFRRSGYRRRSRDRCGSGHGRRCGFGYERPGESRRAHLA